MTLREHADSIPELGHGGRRIADRLIELARLVRPGETIVDIGPYLGSTTAYLALGARPRVVIHAFDIWDADMCFLREKSRYYHGKELPRDMLPLFLENLKPFGVLIVPHRCDVREAAWNDEPIGLLVDDIGCDQAFTTAKMRTFSPSLILGAVLVLMDYYWYETKPGDVFDYQRRFVERNAHAFGFVERQGIAAFFEWKGGELEY